MNIDKKSATNFIRLYVMVYGASGCIIGNYDPLCKKAGRGQPLHVYPVREYLFDLNPQKFREAA